MKIDHLCFAVDDVDEGINYWSNTFGYFQITEIVINTRQKVKVVFMSKEESITIKLIQPLENNKSLLNFVCKGGGFHHICFKCDDLNEKINQLKEKGLILLVPPQPGEAFNDNRIAFMLAKYRMNIELIDTDEKAGLMSP
jgi:methylmalonyl-CoA/ethylmalonyl-CoA epimerase